MPHMAQAAQVDGPRNRTPNQSVSDSVTAGNSAMARRNYETTSSHDPASIIEDGSTSFGADRQRDGSSLSKHADPKTMTKAVYMNIGGKEFFNQTNYAGHTNSNMSEDPNASFRAGSEMNQHGPAQDPTPDHDLNLDQYSNINLQLNLNTTVNLNINGVPTNFLKQ